MDKEQLHSHDGMRHSQERMGKAERPASPQGGPPSATEAWGPHLTTTQLGCLPPALGNVSARAQCPWKDTALTAKTRIDHKVNPRVRGPEELTEHKVNERGAPRS